MQKKERDLFSLKKIIWMIKKRIIIEEMKNPLLNKLEILRQNTFEIIEKNIASFDYLIDLVPKYDELKYIKGQVFNPLAKEGNLIY